MNFIEPAPDQLKAERKILLSKWQKSKALPKVFDFFFFLHFFQ